MAAFTGVDVDEAGAGDTAGIDVSVAATPFVGTPGDSAEDFWTDLTGVSVSEEAVLAGVAGAASWWRSFSWASNRSFWSVEMVLQLC